MAWRTRGSVMPRAATWRSTMTERRCANSRSLAAISLFCEVAKALLERLETGDRRVVSQVQMQGRDGDAAGAHGLEIGAFAGLPDGRFTADPIVLSSARIESL